MQVAFGADHAGVLLKDELIGWARDAGHMALDLGTNSETPVDYPDFAEAVAQAICDGKADRGVVICGSGVGASVAVNKIPGIRAGLCHDAYSAEQGVEHDQMNVLVLGGRVIGPALGQKLLQCFLEANYTAETRHQRRNDKVRSIEQRYCRFVQGASK
jgi:ribose 5-phosphate isomerase B